MRTSIHIDDHLLMEAKEFAAKTGKSLTSLIVDGLRLVLAKRHLKKRAAPMELPTFKGNGVQAGVDLDRMSDLLDLMEERVKRS